MTTAPVTLLPAWRPRARPLATAALACLLPCAAVAAESHHARIYELSGLRAQIESFIDMPLQGLDGSGRVPTELADAMRRAASRPVDLNALHGNSVKRIESSLDDATVMSALGWLESPLGRRITAAEIEASGSDALSGMMDYARSIADRAPPQRRQALVDRISGAVNANEQARQMMLASALTTALGMNAMLPRSEQLAPGAIRERLDRDLGAAAGSLAPMVRLSMLFAYRNMSDSDLEAYLGYLESAHGRRCTEALARATLDTLGRYTYDLGRAIAEELAAVDRQRAL